MERFGDKVICNPKVKLNKDNTYPLIDINKINPQFRYVSNQEEVTYTGQSCSKFDDHDVLFARITPCLENGKTAIANTNGKSGLGSTELFVFRGIEGISNTDYIYYLLSMPYMRKLAANSMTGASGRQRADLKFIKRIPWTYPNLEVQEKIADILSKYDELIEVNNQRIKKLEQTAEELYKEWFVRFRFPNYQNTEFENGIPRGWQVKRIHEVFDTFSGGTPSRSCAEYYNGQIKWIKTGELKDQPILDTEEKITKDAIKHSAAKIIPKRSLIIAMYGATIGKLGINESEATCNQACCVLRPKTGQCGTFYLYHFFKTNRDYLIGISNGAAQQNLSQETIKRICFLYPSETIAEQFETIVTQLYINMVMIQKENENLIKQRDLLLPRLMSGKLEV